jgi:hypothetical protein
MSEDWGKFTEYHLKRCKEGVECFNAQKYWECHEALEHVWLEDRDDPARNVYWAIIQVASALVHYRDGNLVGANSLLNKSRQKFIRCEEQNIETPLLFDKLEWQKFKDMVFRVPIEPQLEDFKELFDFRFKKYSL